MSGLDLLKDGGYEKGHHQGSCMSCDNAFTGSQNSLHCAGCALERAVHGRDAQEVFDEIIDKPNSITGRYSDQYVSNT